MSNTDPLFLCDSVGRLYPAGHAHPQPDGQLPIALHQPHQPDGQHGRHDASPWQSPNGHPGLPLHGQPAHGHWGQAHLRPGGTTPWPPASTPGPRGYAVPGFIPPVNNIPNMAFFQQLTPASDNPNETTVYVSWQKLEELLTLKLRNPGEQVFNSVYKMLYESFFLCRHDFGSDPRQLTCVCGQLFRTLAEQKIVCITQDMQQFGHHWLALTDGRVQHQHAGDQAQQHQHVGDQVHPQHAGVQDQQHQHIGDQVHPQQVGEPRHAGDQGLQPSPPQEAEVNVEPQLPPDLQWVFQGGQDDGLPQPVPALGPAPSQAIAGSSRDGASGSAIAHRLRSRTRGPQSAPDAPSTSDESEDEDDKWLPSPRRSQQKVARTRAMRARFSNSSIERNDIYSKIRESMAPHTQLANRGGPPPSRWISDIMLETGNHEIPAEIYGVGRVHDWTNDGRASQQVRDGYKYTVASINGTVLWPENSQEMKLNTFCLGLRYLEGSLQRKRRLNKQMKQHTRGSEEYRILQNCVLAEAEQYRLCSLFLGHSYFSQCSSRFISDHNSKPGVTISGNRRVKVKDHWLSSWIPWNILIPKEIDHLKGLRATWNKASRVIYPYGRYCYWLNPTPGESSHDPRVEQRGTCRRRKRHRYTR